MSKHHSDRPNILGPFILIAVGLAFLLQNLGLLGSDIWSTLISFWPLLLIGLGLNGMIRTNGIVGPTFMTGIGSVFMANNLGLLSWDAWMTLLRLWPILIIAIGLEIFIGRKELWLSIIGVAAALSLLVAGLWVSGGLFGSEGMLPERSNLTPVGEEIVHPIDKAKDAEIKIESSVGKLHVESLNHGKKLIEGIIYSVPQERIEESYEKDGSTIHYYLGNDWEPSFPDSLSQSEKQKLSWQLNLTEEIPLDLNLSLGVGESDIDLSDIQLTELDLNIGVGQVSVELPEGEYAAYIKGGVGQTIVTLPEAGKIDLKVSGGVGEIIIYIPEKMAAQINIDRGIAGLSLPNGYRQNEDTYTSPNYSGSDSRVNIELDQGIGNISIQER